MSKSRYGLKAFGLCVLAALGLLAFMVSSASAANLSPGSYINGLWLINGANLTAPETITGKAEVGHEPELLVPGLGLALFCKKLAVTEGSIGLAGVSLAKLSFSECEVLGAKEVCHVGEPIVAKVKDQVIKHEGAVYDVFEPDEAGTPFTRITITGEECPFEANGEPVSGRLVAQINAPAAEQLVSEFANQALFGTGLFYGNEPATLDGAGLVALSGPHAGQPFGAH